MEQRKEGGRKGEKEIMRKKKIKQVGGKEKKGRIEFYCQLF